MYINLTQMTENLQWIFQVSVNRAIFWPTLLKSKWCLQISLRRFITCVMTDRQEILASLILYMLKSTYKITLLFTSNRIAKHSFRFYTFTLKRSSGKSCNISFSWNHIACCIHFTLTLNDASSDAFSRNLDKCCRRRIC